VTPPCSFLGIPAACKCCLNRSQWTAVLFFYITPPCPESVECCDSSAILGLCDTTMSFSGTLAACECCLICSQFTAVTAVPVCICVTPPCSCFNILAACKCCLYQLSSLVLRLNVNAWCVSCQMHLCASETWISSEINHDSSASSVASKCCQFADVLPQFEKHVSRGTGYSYWWRTGLLQVCHRPVISMLDWCYYAS
jgi:hypothetical protein